MPRQAGGQGDDPKVVPLRSSTSDGQARKGRMSAARTYSPRGRTVREQPAEPAPAKSQSAKSQPAKTQSAKSQPAKAKAAKAAQAGTAKPRKKVAADRRTTAEKRAAGPKLRVVKGEAGAPKPPRVARNRPTKVGEVREVRDRPPPPPPKLADPIKRLRVGTAAILVLFVAIAFRLVELQLTDAKAYAEEGLLGRLETVTLPAARGSIVDRNGEVLVRSVEARFVFADPTWVKDPDDAARRLAPLIAVPESELRAKLQPRTGPNGKKIMFEYLARGVSVATAQAVEALHIRGIGTERDERRFVPGHDLAANLIGFTGRDLNGLAGLEASYDEILRGVDGKREYEVGQKYGEPGMAKEIPGGIHLETPARPGQTLKLTVDADLQFEVQRILGVKMAEVKATFGSAVVLDVATGDVLAQASYPFYDAENPFRYKAGDRIDTASGTPVDPGSVHKAIVVAAALEEGVVKPDSLVPVARTIRKGDKTFEDLHWVQKPQMTLPGLLAYSSNVATINLADRLTAAKLYEYQQRFGLGQSTQVGVPGEAAGLIQPPANWSGSSYGSIPIGLSVSATPLQMAAVYAAIANDGVYQRPRLVQATVAPDGTETPAAASPGRRVMSSGNAAALRQMLEAVVTVRGATGRSAAVPGYRVAGKTGTGLLNKDGKYVEGDVASFIGMAPAEQPRYVIAVFAHTPSGTGGKVAGPAFSEMMALTLTHYRVPPTGTKPPTFQVYGP
jgi:cell division protein FtsI (penicillin-binding protein 3)